MKYDLFEPGYPGVVIRMLNKVMVVTEAWVMIGVAYCDTGQLIVPSAESAT
jgi:hypothetical protein